MRATASELLYEAADELRNQLEQLLARSSLTHFDPVMQHSVWFGPTGEWADLDTEGRQIQARLLEDYRHFAATLRTLLRGLTSEALREFEDADTNITEVIDQSKLTFLKTLDDAREHVRLGLGKQEELPWATLRPWWGGGHLRSGHKQSAPQPPSRAMAIH